MQKPKADPPAAGQKRGLLLESIAPEPRLEIARFWRELDLAARILRSAPVYLLSAAITLAALWITQGLSGVDLSKPLPAFIGDAFLSAFVTKSLSEGSLLFNPRVGAPLGLHYHDFFQPDLVHQWFVWALAVISGSTMLAVNLYFLGGFVLAAWCSLFAMRRFGVSPFVGITCSVLYALLPGHFLRSHYHLFLSAYYLAPVVLLVALRLMSGNVAASGDESISPDHAADWRSFWRRPWPWLALLVAAAAGGSGVYYAAYSILFFAVAGLYASLHRGIRRHALLAVACICITAAVTGAGMLPVLRYKAEFGPNPLVANRLAGEGDVLSLKIAYLLLPSPSHRLESFRRKTEEYITSLPVLLANESKSASLGIAGGIGFCSLIFWLLFGRSRTGSDRLMHKLSILNICGVLATVTAGFGSLFALLVTPQLRAHNRISFFLAFLALFALALLLEKIRRQLPAEKLLSRLSFHLLVLAVLVFGIYDQTPFLLWASHPIEARAFEQDADFIGRIEKILPAGSSVLQLPYSGFPETVPPHNLVPYGHLRAYIHSKTLRWSYPQMKGRAGDQWVADLSSLPPPEMVRQAVLAGYSGIYIDRSGYPDGAAALENQIAAASKASPVLNANGKLSFFDLRNYAAVLKAGIKPEEWQTTKAIPPPLVLAWAEGFYQEEREGNRTWHWCQENCDLYITNITPQTQSATLRMQLFTGHPFPSVIESRFGDQVHKVTASQTGAPFSLQVAVRPGSNRLTFSTNAPRIQAPTDPRIMRVRIENLRIEASAK